MDNLNNLSRIQNSCYYIINKKLNVHTNVFNYVASFYTQDGDFLKDIHPFEIQPRLRS